MGKNLYAKDQKTPNDKYRDNYEKTFGKCDGCKDCDCEESKKKKKK